MVSTKALPYMNIGDLNEQLYNTLQKLYEEYRPSLRLIAKMTYESEKKKLTLMDDDIMRKFRKACRSELDSKFNALYVSQMMKKV